MITTIDLTEDASYPAGDGFARRVFKDEGDLVIYLGDEAELRLTYFQFERILTAANRWMAAGPASGEDLVISEGGEDEARRLEP